MQTQHDAAAEEAILSSERVFRARLLIDWNQNGLFEHPLSDMSEFIVSASTDRSLSGSAPEEVMLVQGASAAELTVQLQGEYENILLPSIFSPFNTNSPLIDVPMVGAEVTYEIGVETPLGIFWYPQFVGNVRTTTPNRATNQVEITALDRVEMLRQPVKFPPYAASDYWNNTGRIEAQLIDSSWVIDHCLKHCDTSATAYRWTTRDELGIPEGNPEGIQLWVSHNGAWIPNVGWLPGYEEQSFAAPELTGVPLYERNGQPPADAPDPENKPFTLSSQGADANLGLPSDPYNANRGKTSSKRFNRYWCLDRDLMKPLGTHYFGFTLNTTGNNGDYFRTASTHLVMHIYIGGYQHLQITCTNGKLRISRVYAHNHPTTSLRNVRVNGPEVTVPAEAGSYLVFGVLDNTKETGTRAYLSVGDVATGWQTLGGAPANDEAADFLKGLVQIAPTVGMSDIFYGTRDMEGAPADPAQASRPPKYSATLDDGLQSLSFLPLRNGDEAWQVITDVAAAEYGSVFWDEEGRFRFWNLRTLLLKQNDTVRNFTLDDVSGLQLTNTLDSVRNIWSVAPSRAVETSYGIAYSANSEDEFYVPGRTIKTFRIWSDEVYAPDPDPVPRFHGDIKDAEGNVVTEATWNDEIKHGYVVQYLQGGEWVEINSRIGVEIRANFDGLGNLTVRIDNRWNEPIRLCYGDGDSPAFHLGGTKIERFDPVTVTVRNVESVAKYGGRNLKIEGDWIQDGYSYEIARGYLMPRWLEPNPVTDAITVAGDPRVQLGDTIEISDPEGFGVSMLFQIIGIRREFSLDGGLIDTYTVERVTEWDEPIPPPPPEPEPNEVVRTNICPNPACQNNASGYFGGGARTASIDDPGMPRSTGYKTTRASNLVIGPRIKARPGKAYRMSAYLKGNGGASSGAHYIDWYDSNGWFASTSPDVNSYRVNNGRVIWVSTGTHPAPSGTCEALMIFAEGTGSGVIVTGVVYEEADSLEAMPNRDDFFDGDSPGAYWNGTDGSSTSTVVQLDTP